jgi:Mannosylglycerate hydrolase MGH1-like glycoside hydrolase domain
VSQPRAVHEQGAEEVRLQQDARRELNWKRWGPYLSERQWGTVREDYSAEGDAWSFFPHDHARSRAYRWGEDGLLGICDREGRLCFAVALWNGQDPILKERLFGLSGPEGNHGEDVKEEYYYLDSTPTHSYMKALYKYPLSPYPYVGLVEENRRRGLRDREYELVDTGAFAGGRYLDVFAEYAKASPNDVLVRFTVANRSPETARVAVIPTLWFRNTWSWGRQGEGYGEKPSLAFEGSGVRADHPALARFHLVAGEGPEGREPEWLFTENETNSERLWGAANPSPWVKDAFHESVVNGRKEAVNPARVGTKAGALYRLEIPPGGEAVLRLRLFAEKEAKGPALDADFDRTFDVRRREADAFYAARIPEGATDAERSVMRQGWAGLLWSRQLYDYVVKDWLEGDPTQPPPPRERWSGRNADWLHLYNRDVVSMPDKWEYPWYAAWDLAFHMIPFAAVDPQFAKDQLLLLLREWYMHPNGQIPAYEFAFSDANPPVHAWACWRVYKMTGARGARDRTFLARAFQKLLLNFTWWVNRKDAEGKHIFAGGFLGLDNIGVFDRSRPLPTGGHLEQADGTAWMAFYCTTMLAMALELAKEDPAYEDLASKFFEHFVAIADAINHLGGQGLWDDQDGFYYDQLRLKGGDIPLKVRSAVGLVPLIAVEVLEDEVIDRLPGFRKRFEWFLANRPELAAQISCMKPRRGTHALRLLAIPARDRLERVLRYMLDEREFLSPHGLRSLSRVHAEHPYVFRAGGEDYRVDYVPAEGNTHLFGGNSNWRGPVWFPLNFLLVEALERYHHFYEDTLTVEYPTGSGHRANLRDVARDLAARLGGIFLPDERGRRPVHGGDERYATDPHWKDFVLFYEYFDGDTGRGVGASHQTGWTALAVPLVREQARERPGRRAGRSREPRSSR